MIGTVMASIPFKIFIMISHLPRTEPVLKLINTIFRIMPILMMYSALYLIVMIPWTLGAFLIMQPYCRDFMTFEASLVSVVIREYWLSNEWLDYFQQPNIEFAQVYSIFCFYTRLTTLLLFAITITYYYRKTGQLEKIHDIRAD